MAKAVKLKSGNYCCRVYDKYLKKQVCFTEPTKKEAERKAQLYALTNKPKADVDIKFKDAAEMYFSNKSKVLSPNTLRDYRSSLKNHCSAIVNRNLMDISDITLQVLVNDLASDLSPKSVKNVYTFIVTIIRSVYPQKTFNVTLPKKVKADIKILSESDIKAVFKEIKDTDMEAPVKMALNICMRRGEISSVLNHPECVGKDSVTIKYNTIKGNELGSWIEKSPKTFSSYRTVHCEQPLIQVIKNAEYVNPGYITDKWIKLMKKMGMSYRFHDLRHTSASMMLAAGVPMVDVEYIGGWEHGSTVLRTIYEHVVDASVKNSAKKWQNKLSSLEN